MATLVTISTVVLRRNPGVFPTFKSRRDKRNIPSARIFKRLQKKTRFGKDYNAPLHSNLSVENRVAVLTDFDVTLRTVTNESRTAKSANL